MGSGVGRGTGQFGLVLGEAHQVDAASEVGDGSAFTARVGLSALVLRQRKAQANREIIYNANFGGKGRSTAAVVFDGGHTVNIANGLGGVKRILVVV